MCLRAASVAAMSRCWSAGVDSYVALGSRPRSHGHYMQTPALTTMYAVNTAFTTIIKGNAIPASPSVQRDSVRVTAAATLKQRTLKVFSSANFPLFPVPSRVGCPRADDLPASQQYRCERPSYLARFWGAVELEAANAAISRAGEMNRRMIPSGSESRPEPGASPVWRVPPGGSAADLDMVARRRRSSIGEVMSLLSSSCVVSPAWLADVQIPAERRLEQFASHSGARPGAAAGLGSGRRPRSAHPRQYPWDSWDGGMKAKPASARAFARLVTGKAEVDRLSPADARIDGGRDQGSRWSWPVPMAMEFCVLPRWPFPQRLTSRTLST